MWAEPQFFPVRRSASGLPRAARVSKGTAGVRLESRNKLAQGLHSHYNAVYPGMQRPSVRAQLSLLLGKTQVLTGFSP